MPRYQHTQTGWVLIVVMTLTAAIVSTALAVTEPTLVALVLPVLLLPLLLFSRMTVRVTDDEIDVRLGVVPCRRIPLASITHCARVRNPWYYGWGIHLIPGGALYNVSGYDAIELTLSGGRRVRIGTDEPEVLAAALAHHARPPAGGDVALPAHSASPVIALLAVIVVPVAIVISVVFYVSLKPVRVAVFPDTIEIDGGFYRSDVRVSDIERVSLEPALPAVQLRTNGFAYSNTLRGHFRLRTLGAAMLFVERDHPPFIAIRTHGRLVLLNFREPASTEALYATLAALPRP